MTLSCAYFQVLRASLPLESDEDVGRPMPRNQVAYPFVDKAWLEVAKRLDFKTLKVFRQTCRQFARAGLDRLITNKKTNRFVIYNRQDLPLIKGRFAKAPLVCVFDGNTADEDLVHVAHIRNLSLCGCINLGDAGLAHLQAVRWLSVMGMTDITDKGVLGLALLKYIDLGSCPRISTAAKQQLRARGVKVY
ncbi:MAG: hypothetical protein C0514_02550 [Candidatus Puniceispirillum sp.]|nr:hypothetical protein [Candidatus Puniceispirillum sp.]